MAIIHVVFCKVHWWSLFGCLMWQYYGQRHAACTTPINSFILSQPSQTGQRGSVADLLVCLSSRLTDRCPFTASQQPRTLCHLLSGENGTKKDHHFAHSGWKEPTGKPLVLLLTSQMSTHHHQNSINFLEYWFGYRETYWFEYLTFSTLLSILCLRISQSLSISYIVNSCLPTETWKFT